MRLRLVAGSLLLLATAACRGDLSTTLRVPDGSREKLDVAASKADVVLLLRTPSAAPGERGGQTVDLDASVTNPQGRLLPNKKHIEWYSTNETVATVDSAGLITALDTGSVLIVVDEKKVADTVHVRIVPVPVRSVVVSGPDSISVRDTVTYTATALDSVGEPLIGREVTWHSTDGSVLESLGEGIAAGLQVGSAQLEATVDEVIGRASVTVWPAQVATVEVNPAAASIVLYRTTATLNATAKDRHGFVLTDRLASWSPADASMVSVSGGVVSPVAPGVSDVYADVEGVRGTSRVTVTNPVEARALWVNRIEWTNFNSVDSARISYIMRRAGEARFNIVYFQVRVAGDALYNSDIEPCSPRRCGSLGGTRPGFDPLTIAIAEAKKNGIQLHAWLNSMTEWIAGSSTACGQLVDNGKTPRHMRFEHPDWQMLTSNGQPQPCLLPSGSAQPEYTWASPGIPAVRARLAQVAADIARRYDVAGIHLDRIRYPGTTVSYDLPSKNAYASTHNGAFPTTNTSPGWADLRRSFVTAAVREVHDSISAVNPKLVLSAAIWPIYKPQLLGWSTGFSKGFDDYFQDPAAWLAEGTLDVAAPMTYPSLSTSSTYTIMATECAPLDWTCLLMDQKKRVETDGHRHMYIGVGAIKGRDESLRQIAKGRERQVTGFSVYSFSQVEGWNGWPILAVGPFKYPAAIPAMPWK
jgi:uncharacterized lipoprotein YddW (UPF0748 family)/uncharacterized protein YjdB